MSLVTSNEIRKTKICTYHLREGYDMDEVDALLDSAADTIDYLQQHHVKVTTIRRRPTVGTASQLVLRARDIVAFKSVGVKSKSLDDVRQQLTNVYHYLKRFEDQKEK